MSNETVMAHVSSRLHEAVGEAGPVVVTIALNVRYGEKGNKRRKINGEPFGRLTACCITEENRGFLTDNEKNLIYEANIANPLTVEVISKTFKNPTDVILIREKPQHLLICDSLGIGRFHLSSRKTSRPVLKDIGRPFKAALVIERKQVWITDCENKTVVIFSLEGGKTTTIDHKFKEPIGIAFLPVLDVAAVCDCSDCALVLFAKNGDGVLVVNCPKAISPIHVSSFQGVGSAIFLASSTSMLYKMKVTLNASKDGRNSSAVLEEVAAWSSPTPHSQ